jgi:hypothetical protein
MSAHAAAQLLKQQIPLLDYLFSQQWQVLSSTGATMLCGPAARMRNCPDLPSTAVFSCPCSVPYFS